MTFKNYYQTLGNKKTAERIDGFKILRRERDSNSWNSYPFGSLANYWFKPLTHLSGQQNYIAIVKRDKSKSKKVNYQIIVGESF